MMYYGYYIPPPKQPGPPLADELTCLRAIESAAREYRTAYQRDDIWGDEWTIACVEHRARLFGLLEGITT